MDDIKDTPSETTESVLSDSKSEGDQSPSFDWKGALPDNLRSEKAIQDAKDLPTLAKAYVDATKYNVGALKLPGKDASPEEWGKVWSKLGKPESPEGYPQISLEETETIDMDSLDAMKGVAHVAHLTNDQWNTMQEGWVRLQREKNAQKAEQARVTTEELKGEWGGAFDRKLGIAQRTIRTLGGEELLDKVVQTGLGNDAGFIRFLERVGKSLASEGIIDNEFEGQLTKDAATSQINELTVSEAYLSASHPNHREVVAKVQQLFELVYN